MVVSICKIFKKCDSQEERYIGVKGVVSMIL